MVPNRCCSRLAVSSRVPFVPVQHGGTAPWLHASPAVQVRP